MTNKMIANSQREKIQFQAAENWFRNGNGTKFDRVYYFHDDIIAL